MLSTMYDTGAGARAFAEALGAEIGYWRKRRGLTRGELAERAGISETTMGRVEREGPKDVSDTWRLAKALGIPFADLVRRAEEAAEMSELDFGLAAHDSAGTIADEQEAPDTP